MSDLQPQLPDAIKQQPDAMELALAAQESLKQASAAFEQLAEVMKPVIQAISDFAAAVFENWQRAFKAYPDYPAIFAIMLKYAADIRRLERAEHKSQRDWRTHELNNHRVGRGIVKYSKR